jgi:hypothetical protein
MTSETMTRFRVLITVIDASRPNIGKGDDNDDPVDTRPTLQTKLR